MPVRRPCRPVLVLAAALVLGACATNPVTGGHDIVTISEAQEIEIGKEQHPKVLQQYGRYDEAALQAYVNDVGQRIAARIVVLADKAKEQAALAARVTFGEAAARYKAEWVDRNWKDPDKGWTPVRLHLAPKCDYSGLSLQLPK